MGSSGRTRPGGWTPGAPAGEAVSRPRRSGAVSPRRPETILDRILAGKAREVERLLPRESEFRRNAASSPPPRDFARALREGDGVAVVAEFKRRSPSAGSLAAGADPAAVAEAYERGGAAALSVLTDSTHFGGGLEDLEAARRATSLPVLRKDFLLHPVQLAESRAAGADAVLLIAAALTRERLARLLAGCLELGMTALVEVHDEVELEAALAAGAEVVGVNARDLRTFDVDLERCLEVVALVPEDRVAVAESGIQGPDDVGLAARAGADAVLVGSWLMRRDPAAACAMLAGRNRRPRSAGARAGGG